VRSRFGLSRGQFAPSGLHAGTEAGTPCLHGTGPPPEPPAWHRPVRREARVPCFVAY
jgi:hypothetical protein